MEAPRHDPLIEAAIRTISGEEERRQAGAAYLQILREDRTGGEAEIIGRWDSLDRAKPRARGKIGLIAILAILSCWAAVFDLPELRKVFTPDDLIRGYGQWMPESELRLAAKLDPSQVQLLYGDISKDYLIGRKEALHLSDPSNPAYFAEYAMVYFEEIKSLPPGFSETVRRIDPDNAWFTYFSAAAEAGDFGKIDRKRKSSPVGGKGIFSEPIPWKIHDRARLDRVIGMIREARGQGKYETYEGEMLRKRLAILPQETRRERSDSFGYLNTQSSRFYFHQIVSAIAARAWLAGEERNEQDLREVVRDAEDFLRRSLGDGSDVTGHVLANWSHIYLLAGNIVPALDQLKLTDEAAKWHQIESRLSAWVESTKKVRQHVIDGVTVPHGLKTGVIEARDENYLWRYGYAQQPPPLTDEEIAPRRFLDHDYLSHLGCYVTWSLLGVVCVMLSLYRYFTPKVIRGLARRMKPQLGPIDWSWLLGLGVLLPFFLVMFVNRFTPLGGRDYGIEGVLLMLPAGHFLALAVLWLVVPVHVVRWRLGKRLAIFGFGNRNAWALHIATGCAVVFLFVVKWAAITGTVPLLWVRKLDFPPVGFEGRAVWELPLWVVTCILAVSVLWLFYATGAALLGTTCRALYRATAARVLIPVYASAMVVCLAAVPFYKMAEDHWFRGDTLNRFDPAMPAWSRYEYRIAVQAHKEMREVMGYDAAPLQTGE